jgi:adenosylmethionine-8-amino-7-oxononanoate aminotransferase
MSATGGTRPRSADQQHLVEADGATLWHPFTRHKSYDPGRMIVGGDGCWVTDVDGRRLLDAFAGLWSINLGYGRGDIAEAIAAQLRVLPTSSMFGQGHPLAARLAERLAALAPGDLTRVFFSVQGSQAVDTALKLARLYWRARGRSGKTILVTRDRAYHGTSFGGISMQGMPALRLPFEPTLPDVRRIAAPFGYRCRHCDGTCTLGCADELEALVATEGADRIAAVIAEPVLGSGGVIVPDPGYLRRLRELCDRHEILLIADEIMTGFGRTGRMFAIDHFGVVPDMLLVAKGLTAGYMPLAATIVTDDIFRVVTGVQTPGPEFASGNTWDAHPPACAAALAVLDALEGERLVERVAAMAEPFAAAVERVREAPIVGDVRTLGLVAGIELVRDRTTRELHPAEAAAPARFAEHCWQRRVIVRPLANGVVAIAPPFTVAADELAFLGDTLVEAAHATAEDLVR